MKRPVPDQAIDLLTVDGYKVWTGMPIRNRPVWLGSPKTPAEEKKENEFEGEVMEIAASVWDFLENVDGVKRKAFLREMSLRKSESWHKAQVQVKPHIQRGHFVQGYPQRRPDRQVIDQPNIPKELESLASEARKYDKFEEFKNAFLRDIKHGTYYHITHDPNFRVDSESGPRDMSSMATGKVDTGKLMVTSDLRHWLSEYPERKYVAIMDFSEVDPKHYKQVNRGFGNEFFVNDPSKVKVKKVVSRATVLREDSKINRVLDREIRSNETLEEFFNKVKGNLSKTLGYRAPGFERRTSEKGWKKQRPKEEGPVKEKVKRQRYNLPPKLTNTAQSSTHKMGSSW